MSNTTSCSSHLYPSTGTLTCPSSDYTPPPPDPPVVQVQESHPYLSILYSFLPLINRYRKEHSKIPMTSVVPQYNLSLISIFSLTVTFMVVVLHPFTPLYPHLHPSLTLPCSLVKLYHLRLHLSVHHNHLSSNSIWSSPPSVCQGNVPPSIFLSPPSAHECPHWDGIPLLPQVHPARTAPPPSFHGNLSLTSHFLTFSSTCPSNSTHPTHSLVNWCKYNHLTYTSLPITTIKLLSLSSPQSHLVLTSTCLPFTSVCLLLSTHPSSPYQSLNSIWFLLSALCPSPSPTCPSPLFIHWKTDVQFHLVLTITSPWFPFLFTCPLPFVH